MEKKNIFVIVLLSCVFLLSMASAITASIGNSRMILRGDVDEVFERSILVQNTNDETVTIDLSVEGDLEDNVKLDETSFSLQPGAEKKAYFTIFSDEEGTYTTNVNVQYTAQEGKGGVGLTSTIIIIAGDGSANRNEQGDGDETNNDNSVDPDDPVMDVADVENNNSRFSIGNLFGSSDSQESESQGQGRIIVLALIVIVLLIFLLRLLLQKPKSKKEVHTQ